MSNKSSKLNIDLPLRSYSVTPGKAVKEWGEVADIVSGPLFRPVNSWDQVQDRNLNQGAINDLLKMLGEARQLFNNSTLVLMDKLDGLVDKS